MYTCVSFFGDSASGNLVRSCVAPHIYKQIVQQKFLREGVGFYIFADLIISTPDSSNRVWIPLLGCISAVKILKIRIELRKFISQFFLTFLYLFLLTEKCFPMPLTPSKFLERSWTKCSIWNEFKKIESKLHIFFCFPPLAMPWPPPLCRRPTGSCRAWRSWNGSRSRPPSWRTLFAWAGSPP